MPGKFAKKPADVSSWQKKDKIITLLDVVREIKPTILIGVSGQPGLMTEEIIKTMSTHCDNPIILPLSNPTSQVEALVSEVDEGVVTLFVPHIYLNNL